MENEFISYTQALALKELGFDEPCFGRWIEPTELSISSPKDDVYCQKQHEFSWTALAPLYQQAFRWFREKHGMLGCIEFVEPEYGGDYGYKLYYKPGHLYIDHWNKGFKTYEEAEQACLDKLIEICKTK